MKKFTSRKFLICLAGIIIGLCAMFGIDIEGDAVASIAGVVTALASVVTYIATEGKIDAASVKQGIPLVLDVVDKATEAVEYLKNNDTDAVRANAAVEGDVMNDGAVEPWPPTSDKELWPIASEDAP